MSKKIRGFFTPERSWEDEWQDMPECKNEEIKPLLTVMVHFRNVQDVKDFSKLIEQTVTTKTQSIWYPKLVWKTTANKRYVDEP